MDKKPRVAIGALAVAVIVTIALALVWRSGPQIGGQQGAQTGEPSPRGVVPRDVSILGDANEIQNSRSPGVQRVSWFVEPNYGSVEYLDARDEVPSRLPEIRYEITRNAVVLPDWDTIAMVLSTLAGRNNEPNRPIELAQAFELNTFADSPCTISSVILAETERDWILTGSCREFGQASIVLSKNAQAVTAQVTDKQQRQLGILPLKNGYALAYELNPLTLPKPKGDDRVMPAPLIPDAH